MEAYDFPPLAEAMHQHPGLPKVAYMYMLQSQGLLHDTWVYGVDAKRILPTMISPTELMDGAIISGNCVSACDKNNTYVHLNNPVVKSLYEHHGKDLNFVGVIITNENVTLADKKRSSSYAVKLARMLGVDAVVISEEGFGNPDADLIMNCRKSEQAGIKTVLIPAENVSDLAEVDSVVKENVKFIPVKRVDTVLETALTHMPRPVTQETVVLAGDITAKHQKAPELYQ